MADLLQRVFCVFVRPYYFPEGESSATKHRAFYNGEIYGPLIPNTTTQARYKLQTVNVDAEKSHSTLPINESEVYKEDPWFLHSTYASYENMREELKKVIAVYGTGNVLVANYVPIDYEVLPNK